MTLREPVEDAARVASVEAFTMGARRANARRGEPPSDRWLAYGRTAGGFGNW